MESLGYSLPIEGCMAIRLCIVIDFDWENGWIVPDGGDSTSGRWESYKGILSRRVKFTTHTLHCARFWVDNNLILDGLMMKLSRLCTIPTPKLVCMKYDRYGWTSSSWCNTKVPQIPWNFGIVFLVLAYARFGLTLVFFPQIMKPWSWWNRQHSQEATTDWIEETLPDHLSMLVWPLPPTFRLMPQIKTSLIG